jgi:pimeloyl-ACP methyl ester carboxylesterase
MVHLCYICIRRPLWDPFIEGLCERHTVYAPHHPGTGETVRESISVESLWDLILMACELAAYRPERVSKMIVLDPIGLWREDAPVAQYMLMPPEQLVATLYKRLDAPAVQAALQMPTDPKQVAVIVADLIWALGATGKFVWPIPDKGLKKRLHRVTAPTMIIWGEDDALISSVYAKEFADRIANSRIEIIKDCGHVPQVERLEIVKPLVAKFLDA